MRKHWSRCIDVQSPNQDRGQFLGRVENATYGQAPGGAHSHAHIEIDEALMWQYAQLLKQIRRLHDSDEHFAYSLIAEGMRTLETVEFGRGNTVGRVVIKPDDNGGYDVQIEDADGMGVET